MGSLSSVQSAILVGSLLGDGTLRRQGNRKNALFEVNHSHKQKEYVDWKWQHFHKYILTQPKARKSNGFRIAYRFTTQSLPIFTEYYRWFYSNGKGKEIPTNLKLNKLSLAVWFMDDGSMSYSSFYLNTQQFSLSEQEFLIKLLLKTFGLNSALNRDKKYFRLRINNESSKLMKKIIEPYVIPSLRYKLGYDPVTTELKNEISVR
ncbi:MAG TPA: LAGLIDADG endonuclease [Candidatus Saccharimonadia bacterium]|nr:LAGLIDADG endonuclease [Candidatus Saccharimonadia bacterium]